MTDRRKYDFLCSYATINIKTRSKNELPFKIMEFTANRIISISRTMRGMNSLANYEFGGCINGPVPVRVGGDTAHDRGRPAVRASRAAMGAGKPLRGILNSVNAGERTPVGSIWSGSGGVAPGRCAGGPVARRTVVVNVIRQIFK